MKMFTASLLVSSPNQKQPEFHQQEQWLGLHRSRYIGHRSTARAHSKHRTHTTAVTVIGITGNGAHSSVDGVAVHPVIPALRS